MTYIRRKLKLFNKTINSIMGFETVGGKAALVLTITIRK